MIFSEVAKIFVSVIFPKFCVGCKTTGTLLCQKCALQIQYVYDQNCPICHHPSIGGRTHPRCQSAWGIDGLVSICLYRGPIRALIRQLKYSGATVTSELIEQIIINYQLHETILLPPGIITAIPLDNRTQKERGFNQSENVAATLCRQLDYPYIPDILQRQSKAISQTKLSREDRRQNMRGAFCLASQLANTKTIKGSTIIIVDDVYTTGATLQEAAKVLKRAGAAKVYGFTLAQD